MANIVAASFYANALPPTDDAARLTIGAAEKGHVNLGVYNTDSANSRRYSGYIKKAIGGGIFYFAKDRLLLPGQSRTIHRMLNLSASDEIHIWGDSAINCLIDGGIES